MAIQDPMGLEKLEQIKVKEVMLRKLKTVNLKTSLKKIFKRLRKQKYPCLPVIEEDRLVGIITESDILEMFKGLREYEAVGIEIARKEKKTTAACAKDLMTSELAQVKPDQSLKKALELMLIHETSDLPVVANKEFKGIVTLRHIIGKL